MDWKVIKNKLESYKKKTLENSQSLKIAILASVCNETKTMKDFKSNSVITSYLSREECNRMIQALRNNNIYTQLYTDVEDFFEDYYDSNFFCNIIFETSPKGISRGKDALIPAFCDMVGIKHIGPDAASNLICCNKYQWYCMLKNNNIPVPESFLFNKRWINHPHQSKTYLLKLTQECASIGLNKNSVIKNDYKLLTQRAMKLSNEFNEPVIAQEFIDGYEVEVPILVNDNNKIILKAIGLSINSETYLGKRFFDYTGILNDTYGVYSFEDIEPKLATQIYNIVKKIIDVLDLRGYFRIDFRVSKEKGPFVIDINNDPTIGIEGSFSYSLKLMGFSHDDILPILIGNVLSNKSNTEYQ